MFSSNNVYAGMQISCIVNHAGEFFVTFTALKNQSYNVEKLDIIFVFLVAMLILVQRNWKVRKKNEIHFYNTSSQEDLRFILQGSMLQWQRREML